MENLDDADVVTAMIDAFYADDRDTLRLLLHPYLHWTDASGRRIRGRTKVLNLLDEAADLGSPAAIELRDGQVYRWTVAPHVAR